MFRFRLDGSSGVPPYLQLVQQVRQSLLLGYLRSGDQLPTVKEVAVDLAINPNTVVKAYRQLEHEGLTAGRPGQGTFITGTMAEPGAGAPAEAGAELRRSLERWLRDAAEAGLSEEAVTALIASVRRDAATAADEAAADQAGADQAGADQAGADQAVPDQTAAGQARAGRAAAEAGAGRERFG
jgi:GntR family transcriptional regulator